VKIKHEQQKEKVLQERQLNSARVVVNSGYTPSKSGTGKLPKGGSGASGQQHVIEPLSVSFTTKDGKAIPRKIVRPIYQRILKAQWEIFPILDFDGIHHLIFTHPNNDAVWEKEYTTALKKIGFVSAIVKRPEVVKCPWEKNPVSETKTNSSGVRKCVPAFMR
jgi:hypothetical protein